MLSRATTARRARWFPGVQVTCAKQALRIKKLLSGQPLEEVINRAAMANSGCLDGYVAFARQRSAVSVG